MSEQQQQQQQQPYCRLGCFLNYINFKFVNEEQLNLVIDYICGNLNANYQPNYPYWYNMYSYTTKSRIVLRHKKQNGDEFPRVKLGQCVCQNEIIDFLKNSDNKCFCNKGCASVYYKAVF